MNGMTKNSFGEEIFYFNIRLRVPLPGMLGQEGKKKPWFLTCFSASCPPTILDPEHPPKVVLPVLIVLPYITYQSRKWSPDMPIRHSDPGKHTLG